MVTTIANISDSEFSEDVKLDAHGKKHLSFNGDPDPRRCNTAKFTYNISKHYGRHVAEIVAIVKARIAADPDAEFQTNTWCVQRPEVIGVDGQGSTSYTISLKGSDDLGWHIHPIADAVYNKNANKSKKAAAAKKTAAQGQAVLAPKQAAPALTLQDLLSKPIKDLVRLLNSQDEDTVADLIGQLWGSDPKKASELSAAIAGKTPSSK